MSVGASKNLLGDCCGKCSFAAKPEGDVQGAELICRRFPPTGQMVTVQVPPSVKNPNGGMAQAIGSVWAPVQPAQWCGEYLARPTGKPD